MKFNMVIVKVSYRIFGWGKKFVEHCYSIMRLVLSMRLYKFSRFLERIIEAGGPGGGNSRASNPLYETLIVQDMLMKCSLAHVGTCTCTN